MHVYAKLSISVLIVQVGGVKMSLLYLITDIQGGMARNPGPGLYEFLMEAELQQYYAGIRGLFLISNCIT